jgi:hypothetical protein
MGTICAMLEPFKECSARPIRPVLREIAMEEARKASHCAGRSGLAANHAERTGPFDPGFSYPGGRKPSSETNPVTDEEWTR